MPSFVTKMYSVFPHPPMEMEFEENSATLQIDRSILNLQFIMLAFGIVVLPLLMVLSSLSFLHITKLPLLMASAGAFLFILFLYPMAHIILNHAFRTIRIDFDTLQLTTESLYFNKSYSHNFNDLEISKREGRGGTPVIVIKSKVDESILPYDKYSVISKSINEKELLQQVDEFVSKFNALSSEENESIADV